MEITALLPFSEEVGYLSLALLSFFGSLVPFVPIPSFILLATMSVGDKFDLHILAISSAVLSAAAKQIIFYVGYGSGRIIGGSTRARMRPFERLVKRYGAAAAFGAAATPIPDDLVYLPLGLARYNPARFFVATLVGKLVLHYIIVGIAHYVGLSLLSGIIEDIEDPAYVYAGLAVFVAILAVMVVLMLRLDWARVLGRVAPWTLDDDGKK